ncbi:E3 ubiquitin-protein ligase hrd1 [Microbotryomycetes sp. JL221]|nr:E3 ubiquitin-protein ligase hrd1 [Microbotryomycetes sp. JL221]
MMQLPRLSRLQLYGLASTVCFVSAIINAFRVRSNFYSAAVYLSKSNACMMIMWNQGIYQTVLLGKLVQLIFFGELRMIEVERLQERAWFAVTETLLALTIFKDDFESSFVMLFVSLLFLKVFHWLASDRVEQMEQSAQVPRIAHVRMTTLLAVLWVIDGAFVALAIESILVDGPTVMIMFASEYTIMLASLWSITMKYIICCIDLRSEVPWENKSLWGLYVDLVADFFKLVTYLVFFTLILTFYGLPLNILRDVYITVRSFILKCRDLRRYRAATRNMDLLYPDATLQEMDAMRDKTCIICREDMEFRGVRPDAEAPTTSNPSGQQNEANSAPQGVSEAPAPAAAATTTPRPPPTGLNDTPKKLPCGHVFHFHCLKSWLERQQSCPTCRRPVLPGERERAGLQAQLPQQQQQQQQQLQQQQQQQQIENMRQARINVARNLGRNAFAVLMPNVPFPPEADQPAPDPDAVQQPTPAPAATEQADSVQPTPTTAANVAQAVTAPDDTANRTDGATATTPGPSTTTSATPGPTQASSAASASRHLPQVQAQAGAAAPPVEQNPLARFALPELPMPPLGRPGSSRSSLLQQVPLNQPARNPFTAQAWSGAQRQYESNGATSFLASPSVKGKAPATDIDAAKAGDVSIGTKARESAADAPPVATPGIEAALKAAENRANAASEEQSAVGTESMSTNGLAANFDPESSSYSTKTTRSGPSLVPLFSLPGAASQGRSPFLADSNTPSLAARPIFDLKSTSAFNDSEKQDLSESIDTGLKKRLKLLLEYQTRISKLTEDLNRDLDGLASHAGDLGHPRASSNDEDTG